MYVCLSVFLHKLWYVSKHAYLLYVFLICEYLSIGPLLHDKLNGWVSDTCNLDILSIHFYSHARIDNGIILCFTDYAHACPNIATGLVTKTTTILYRVFFFKRLDFQNGVGYYYFLFSSPCFPFGNRLFNFKTKLININASIRKYRITI